MENEWVNVTERKLTNGDMILLPGLKGIFEVRDSALYERGKLAVPVCLVEKYKLYNETN